MPDIVICNVCKSYKKQVVLDNVSMDIQTGRIYGIVGRNGSGKTVLLKILCGFVYPDSGEVLIDGKQIGRNKEFPQDLGVVFDTPSFVPYYSGYKNLKLLADIKKQIKAEEIKDVMRRLGLNPDSKKMFWQYSVGMKQRLAISQAIMENPRLLILDEPMNGLDEDAVVLVRGIIKELAQKGTTVIMTSHNREDVALLCDYVYKISKGKISEEINV